MRKTVLALCACALLAAAILTCAGCSVPTISYALTDEGSYINITYAVQSDWTMEEPEDSVEKDHYDAQGNLVLNLDFELPDSVLDTTEEKIGKVLSLYENDSRYQILSKEDTSVDGLDAVKLEISDTEDTASNQDTVFVFTDNGYFIYMFRIKDSDKLKDETIDEMRLSIDVNQSVSVIAQGSLELEDGSTLTLAVVDRYGTRFTAAKLYCASDSSLENCETAFAVHVYCCWVSEVWEFDEIELSIREATSDTVGYIAQDLVDGEWEFDEFTKLPNCLSSGNLDAMSQESMNATYTFIVQNFRLEE